jgi:hypothetical protein
MKERTLFWIKLMWIILNLVLLGYILFLETQQRWEEEIIVFYILNALSFPSGLISYLTFVTIIASLERVLGSINNMVAVVFTLAVLIAAGYWQWFKLLPYFVRKLDSKRFDAPGN